MPLRADPTLHFRKGRGVRGDTPEPESRPTEASDRLLEAIRDARKSANESIIRQATERFARELEAEMPPD